MLAVLFGVTTFAATFVAIFLYVDRSRLRQRFANILDLDREILSRRHAFSLELARRQVVFDSELAARRRTVESELAKQSAALRDHRPTAN